MVFSAEFLERLKAANPIAEVMGEYVSTKRAGRDYVCLCPFHNEKTPSCYIHPDREFFHCFGCGAGGDVISFIMKYHNLDYVEAIKMLAERANMEMPEDDFRRSGSGNTAERRKKIYDMNRDAAKFFYHQLSKPEGAKCVRYLMQTRRLSPQTIKRYGMGYAPNSWSALKQHMLGLGYTERELEDAGLISRSKNNTKKTFDFFVDRAMFPFIDLTGHIVGFGGRTLGDDKRKYLNSRDSLVYNKNKFLFSMNIAKNSAVKSGRVLLCEGNLDVISLTQAGFDNAVASCGTALTPEQAKLISNYAKEVVICYDADEAGQKATQKAIGILSSAGLKTTVIQMRGAKDPDEFIGKFGAAAFEQLLEKAAGAVTFRLQKAKNGLDLATDAGKLEYKDAAVKILAALGSPVERDLYGHRVAEELGVQYQLLEQEIKNSARREYYRKQKKQTQEMLRFADRRDPLNPQAAAHPGEANAEELLICYLYNNPDYYPEIVKICPPEKFVTEFNRRVYEFICSSMETMRDHSVSSMNEQFTPEEIGAVTRILERGRREGITREVADDCAQRLLAYRPKLSGGELSDDDFAAKVENMRKNKM